jgi:carbonic anhydrase
MITVNKNLQFTHPNLTNFNPNTVRFDDSNVLDRADLRADDTPDSVIDRLVIGNQQFVELRANQLQRNNSVRLSGAAKGNNPFAAILNYAKLSTSVEEIFDRKFGELFTIDSAVQTTTRKEISAIEYGVLMMGIKVVIVLVDAPKDDEEISTEQKLYQPHQPFRVEIEHNKILISGISTWQREHQQATSEDTTTNLADRLAQLRAEAEAVATLQIHQQIDKLKTSKLLSQFIDDGSLKIVGGVYDPESCRVTIDS